MKPWNNYIKMLDVSTEKVVKMLVLDYDDWKSATQDWRYETYRTIFDPVFYDGKYVCVMEGASAGHKEDRRTLYLITDSRELNSFYDGKLAEHTCAGYEYIKVGQPINLGMP